MVVRFYKYLTYPEAYEYVGRNHSVTLQMIYGAPVVLWEHPSSGLPVVFTYRVQVGVSAERDEGDSADVDDEAKYLHEVNAGDHSNEGGKAIVRL